ncbi:hypothetical protein OLZ32_28050 [Rhizobium sp. 1AS11]|uniref:hypothetical protein n=1 Tax=Rhizobium acaciae TaxID=2989736 RepID=UPI0022225EAA|nr:hypothetical protein [Rhizobium acaciae]MCW1412207.1 hypothetical protein [Rhizobium acaciae]MCW1744222.1 hypothetical protein [Rhizobium acaciae]
MANPRKLITAAIAEYLRTPVTTDPLTFRTDAKGRALDSDSTPPDADGLAEINVVFARETIDATTQHQGGPRRRVMQVSVECYSTASKDAADDLAMQVEDAMRENPTLGNTVESLILTDVDLYIAERDSFALFAAMMKWEVVYWTHVQPDETGRPTTVLLGFAPEIGPGSEPDYSTIIGGVDV